MDFWYVAIGMFFQLWVQDIVTFLDLFQALLRWCSFHPRRSCARRLAIRSLVDYAADFACRSFLVVQWLQCQCVQGAQYACSPIQQGIYCLCNIFRGEYHVLCVSGEIRQHLLNICLGMRSDMTWYDLTPDCTSRLWVMPPCEWHWTTGTGAQSQGKSFGHFQCTRFLHVNCNTLQCLIVQIQFVLEANDWADKQQRSTVSCQVAHNLALPLSGPETYRGPQLNVGPQACHWTGCDTKSLGSLLH